MRCNFDRLCLYLNHKLDEDRQYEVLCHLHECDICMEAVMLMSAEKGEECPVSNNPARWTVQKKGHSKRAAAVF